MFNKKHILTLFFIYFSSLLVPAMASQGGRVHAILVADTLAGIQGMETNIDMMAREAKRIAAATDLPLQLAVFEDFEVRIENILDYIKKLKVEPDDIIFFYINNHGSRLKNKDNQWPDLIFSLDQWLHPDNYRIDFQELSGILKNTNPRLLLSIAEACNSIRDKDDGHKMPVNAEENKDDDEDEDEDDAEEEDLTNDEHAFELTVGPTTELHLRHNDRTFVRIRSRTENDTLDFYRKLFLENSGTILVTSSSPGEVAMSGFFTSEFLDALDHAAIWGNISGATTWNDILTHTKRKVHNRYENQENISHGEQKTQTIQYELQLQ